MVQKVYFPRLALPISVVPGALLDFLVAFVFMVVLWFTTGVSPSLSLLTLPLWLGLLVLISLGLGLVSAALMVSYRDVSQILPVVVQMLLYISPVAYSLTAIPQHLRFWYSLNPLVGIIEGFRWSLISGYHISVWATLYSCACTIALFFIGTFVFKRMERRFADVV
jgi:lipopolysaccharide transport system permease protein